MARPASEIQAEVTALERRLTELRIELAETEGVASTPAEADERKDRPIRVVIADDEEDIRELVGTLIVTQADLELVGVAKDTTEAVALVLEHKPDVAVFDLSMPGGGGAHAALQVLRELPQTKIVVFTAHDTPEAQLDVMRAGAVSFLIKGAPNQEILRTIRQAAGF